MQGVTGVIISAGYMAVLWHSECRCTRKMGGKHLSELLLKALVSCGDDSTLLHLQSHYSALWALVKRHNLLPFTSIHWGLWL